MFLGDSPELFPFSRELYPDANGFVPKQVVGFDPGQRSSLKGTERDVLPGAVNKKLRGVRLNHQYHDTDISLYM